MVTEGTEDGGGECRLEPPLAHPDMKQRMIARCQSEIVLSFVCLTSGRIKVRWQRSRAAEYVVGRRGSGGVGEAEGRYLPGTL